MCNTLTNGSGIGTSIEHSRCVAELSAFPLGHRNSAFSNKNRQHTVTIDYYAVTVRDSRKTNDTLPLMVVSFILL